jgi:hypothetical protein
LSQQRGVHKLRRTVNTTREHNSVVQYGLCFKVHKVEPAKRCTQVEKNCEHNSVVQYGLCFKVLSVSSLLSRVFDQVPVTATFPWHVHHQHGLRQCFWNLRHATVGFGCSKTNALTCVCVQHTHAHARTHAHPHPHTESGREGGRERVSVCVRERKRKRKRKRKRRRERERERRARVHTYLRVHCVHT